MLRFHVHNNQLILKAQWHLHREYKSNKFSRMKQQMIKGFLVHIVIKYTEQFNKSRKKLHATFTKRTICHTFLFKDEPNTFSRTFDGSGFSKLCFV